MNLTTFRLDKTNFIRIFENTTQQHNMYQNLLRQDCSSHSQFSYSFCLVKLVMQATNVAQVHFGFYQVNHSQREAYIREFKKQVNREQQPRFYLRSSSNHKRTGNHTQSELPRHSHQSYFKCHEKNVASMLFQLPREYCYSLARLAKEQQCFQEWESEPVVYEP